MFASMRKAGLGGSSCERVSATLRAALTVAVGASLMGPERRRPGDRRVPRRTRRRRAPVRRRRGRAVRSPHRGRDDEARWLLALLGMRPGEVLGLDWSAVDLDDGWVHVRQQLVVDYPYRHGCDLGHLRPRTRDAVPSRAGGRLLTGLKSFESRRTLALPDRVVVALQRRHTAWQVDRATAAQWDTGGVTSCSPHPRVSPIDMHADRRQWRSLIADTGSTTGACTTHATPRRHSWSRPAPTFRSSRSSSATRRSRRRRGTTSAGLLSPRGPPPRRSLRRSGEPFRLHSRLHFRLHLPTECGLHTHNTTTHMAHT